MIVATAGHVDHGKTSLIKHLTGVDTDRLAEEKRRGLTIDLGFAYRPLNPQTTLGFIDVPGHSRFINTMIAGVSGIDLGMLIVAADDGPMPQTLEHLDVMRLLGVAKFIVVVTKIDRVDQQRAHEVAEAASALVPECERVFSVSNINQQGIAELQTWLDERALAFQQRKSQGNFRLPVDRAFTLKGVGLVVTGTAVCGQVAVGDELELLPGGGKIRVRSLRVQDAETQRGQAGDRCALNIVGAQTNIARGDTLATIDSLSCSKHLDAHFSLLADAPYALKHLTPVKLYIGTQRLPASLYYIQKPENGRLAPGSNALVQLILGQTIVCSRGDRFLIRDHSESITLGGGEILDPAAPKVGKSRQHRLDFLAAMQQTSVEAMLSALLKPDSAPLNISTLRKRLNISAEELAGQLEKNGAVLFEAGPVHYAVSPQKWAAAQKAIVSMVDTWHTENPQKKGVAVLELQTLFVRAQPGAANSKLFKAALASQIRQTRLSLAGGLITASHHRAVLSAAQQVIWDKVHNRLGEQAMKIPSLADLVEQLGLERQQLLKVLEAAARIKLVHKISDARFGLSEHLLQHAQTVAELAVLEEGITVINYKNKIGSGRKLAIDILEYFDSLRYTQRRGDSRVILDASLPEKLFAR